MQKPGKSTGTLIMQLLITSVNMVVAIGYLWPVTLFLVHHLCSGSCYNSDDSNHSIAEVGRAMII